MLINDMVKRKQLELLGGGFYDPILPVIPNSDRSGQIEALTTYLRKHFGKRPRGGLDNRDDLGTGAPHFVEEFRH